MELDPQRNDPESRTRKAVTTQHVQYLFSNKQTFHKCHTKQNMLYDTAHEFMNDSDCCIYANYK